jgi:uncharacterized protein YkuJ
MISGICIETNMYISPKYASKSCSYMCPECHKCIILCKGDVIKPYFKHKTDIQPCKYYNTQSESQTHKDAKEQIRYWLQNKYNINITRKCLCCSRIETFEIPVIDEKSKIHVEYRFEYNGLKIADVCYLDEDEILCIFEIYHTHKTESMKRPGMWFELDATDVISHDYADTNITLQCIRKEHCDDCIDKELTGTPLMSSFFNGVAINNLKIKRECATNILYGWLKTTHIKPFNYFQNGRVYHSTEVLENDYFNIAIYEKWEDNDVILRYKIRLCFDNEVPNFQGYDDIDLGIVGLYFVNMNWVFNQKVIPDFIIHEHCMDYFINGYKRNCTANNGKCDMYSNCPYNKAFRVKYLDIRKQSYRMISADNWCDIEHGSENIPCILCNKEGTMQVMHNNKISPLYCKKCDIECFCGNKLYFDVPYHDKDKFSELGGRWDPNKRKWFYPTDNEEKLEHIKELFSE